MSNSLFDLVKRDAKRAINSGGYQVDIEIKTPDNSRTENITGWAVKHWNSFETEENIAHTKVVRATIDEEVLVSLGYPVRNAKGEIRLIDHKVSYADSSGITKTYIVRENWPDENLGLIVLILGDFKNS